MSKKLKWWQSDYDPNDNNLIRVSNTYGGALKYYLILLPFFFILFNLFMMYDSPDDPFVPEPVRKFVYKIKGLDYQKRPSITDKTEEKVELNKQENQQ